jgi:nuclear RNA export factor
MGRNFQKKNLYQIDRRFDNNEHDDRGGMHADRGNIRNRLGPKRVGFDVGTRGGGIQKRNFRDDKRIHNKFNMLGDEDVRFEDRDQAGRSRPGPNLRRNFRGGQRGGSRIPVSDMRRTTITNFTWYKMRIRNGNKYDKTLMLKEMINRSKVKFIPLCYSENQSDSSFFIEDVEAAKAVKALTNTIEMPDGFTLQITMEATTPPNAPVNEKLKDRIKVEMSQRYNLEKKALNLSAFHKAFAGDEFYAPLWRRNILQEVAKIIVENIPDIAAIDFSNNKMMNLDALGLDFRAKLTNLRIIYMKDNKLANVVNLEKLKGLDLIELNCSGNPFKDRLGSAYSDRIRTFFPNLQVLDDKPMPKKIGFDDDASTAASFLPASIPKLVKSEEAGALVLQFLEQYFKLYDSDNRQPLLDAYDENAMMSMSCFGGRESMRGYLEDSRNFLRIPEYRANKLLNKGRLPVVSFLTKLPKTTHDPTTFTLDLPFTSPTLMMFTVTGIFKERGEKESKVRHFSRCFLVSPRGSGFVIINETLYITDPTAENHKRALQSPGGSMASLNLSAAAATTSPVTQEVDQATQKTLALAFCDLTGMNLEWSARALSENHWNYDRANQMFQQAKVEGKIPPEAFIK